jgi:uncharacterized protein (TIGR02453 family)
MSDANHLNTTLQFLAELGLNNNKAWFDQHRKQYEAARDAYFGFIDEVIDEFRDVDHLGGLTAKDCTARIYRDLRFTRDKSPYKTNMGAIVAPGGWKGEGNGYYVSIEPGGYSMAAGGWYMPTSDQLNRFREAVDRDPDELRAILEETTFIDVFGALEGERLKTAPKGYDPTHPDIDLLRLKQITVIHHYPDQEVLMDNFKDQVELACRAMRPFLDYLDSL